MRYIIILLTLALANCAPQTSSKNGASVEKCNSSIASQLSQIRVGDLRSDHPIMATIAPSVYESGSYCSNNYQFDQFNVNTYDWCYYYSIDVDCDTGQITSIYRGD